MRGGSCLRNKQPVKEEVGGTVGLVANGTVPRATRYAGSRRGTIESLRLVPSGRRWAAVVIAAEKAVVERRLFVGEYGGGGRGREGVQGRVWCLQVRNERW